MISMSNVYLNCLKLFVFILSIFSFFLIFWRPSLCLFLYQIINEVFFFVSSVGAVLASVADPVGSAFSRCFGSSNNKHRQKYIIIRIFLRDRIRMRIFTDSTHWSWPKISPNPLNSSVFPSSRAAVWAQKAVLRIRIPTLIYIYTYIFFLRDADIIKCIGLKMLANLESFK